MSRRLFYCLLPYPQLMLAWRGREDCCPQHGHAQVIICEAGCSPPSPHFPPSNMLSPPVWSCEYVFHTF